MSLVVMVGMGMAMTHGVSLQKPDQTDQTKNAGQRNRRGRDIGADGGGVIAARELVDRAA
jgi:hypothetical protein